MFEKRAVEIEFTAVLKFIPFIAPPTFGAVNWKRAIAGKDGDHGRAAVCAGASVKHPFIAERNTELVPTIRTHFGQGKFVGLVKFAVAWEVFKTGLAMGTGWHEGLF